VFSVSYKVNFNQIYVKIIEVLVLYVEVSHRLLFNYVNDTGHINIPNAVPFSHIRASRPQYNIFTIYS